MALPQQQSKSKGFESLSVASIAYQAACDLSY